MEGKGEMILILSPVVLFMMGIQMLSQRDFTYKRASRGKSAEESHCPFARKRRGRRTKDAGRRRMRGHKPGHRQAHKDM